MSIKLLATKAAIVNFTGGLTQSLAEKGIRVNSVAPGPIWTLHNKYESKISDDVDSDANATKYA